MASQYIVDSPYTPFTLKDQFKSVSNGNVYIGAVDRDPLNPSQRIKVFVANEDGSTPEITQPIALNAGGFLTYNGQVAKIITKEPYSMVVLDKKGAELWRVSDITKVDPADGLKQWSENLYPLWINNFPYSKGMTVIHKGDSWISNSESNTEEPGAGVKWSLKLERRVTTSTGDQTLVAALEARGGSGTKYLSQYKDNLQSAFDDGGVVVIDGQFEITSRLNVKSNTFVCMSGSGSYIKNTDTTESTISGRPSTDNGVFQCECGVVNVVFYYLDIRGPWYGISRPYRDNNIGINIKGRFDQSRLNEPTTGVSLGVSVIGCIIDGFGQSAIIADNVTRLKVKDNYLQNCGRDGLRMYGCVDFVVTGNSVQNISPGYDGAAPNFNVYGISATTVYAQPLSTYRQSERGVISCNNVADCSTWKSLDTHGGRDIVFSGNTCTNSHIGIGVDKGGRDDFNNLIPAERIVISNNIIINKQTDKALKRAGITVFADGSAEAVIGKDVIISGNYIEGFGGQTKDGGISISQQRDVSITGNILVNNYYSGLFAALTCESVVFTGNTVRNVITSDSGVNLGVATSSAAGDLLVDGNTFKVDSGAAFRPMNIPNSPGLSVYYGDSNRELGTLSTGGLIYSKGGKVSRTVAFARVGSDGTLLAGYGMTVTYVSTGRYDVTVTDTSLLAIFPTVTLYTATVSGGEGTLRNIGARTFTVITHQSGGLADTSFVVQVNGY